MAMNIITAKIKLLPTAIQAKQLHKTLLAGKDALNFASEIAYANNCITSPRRLQKLVYHDLRTQFGIKSQMACNICSLVAGAYASMATNYPRLKADEKRRAKKHNREPKELVPGKATFGRLTMQFSYNRDMSFDKEKAAVGITTPSGRIIVPIAPASWRYDDSWRIAAAMLVEKKNAFYLHLTLKKDIVVCSNEQLRDIVAADFGMNFIIMAINSQGKILRIPGRYMKNKKAEFQRVRKSLQQRKTSSSRRRLKKLGDRENRWQLDVNHRVAKTLVAFANKNSLIIMEDLTGIRAATERVKRKNRYYSVSWPYSDLRMKIEYKQAKNGGQSMVVDPAYTSQQCPKCGYISRSNRDKRKHLFTCGACGYRSNDDRVAAINLRHKGIEACRAVSGEAALFRNGVQSITPRCNTTAHAEQRKKAKKQPVVLPGSYKPLPLGGGS